MSELHQFVLDCGATFTDELYKLTRLTFSPFAAERQKQKKIAEANIKSNCSRGGPVLRPATAPMTGTTTSPAASPP